MKRSLRLTSGFLLTTALLSVNGHAASFDEAVNHYLKGFEACQEANKALQADQHDKAKKKMAEYQRYFKEALAIDKSIATSRERNMEGNILICKRIEVDISNKAGEPIMERAIAQCKEAERALESEDPSAAAAMLVEFRKLKDEALNRSPGLGDIFAIKNQLNKCERMENKIDRVTAKQEAAESAVKKLKTASENYVKACNEATKALEKDQNESGIKAANAKLAAAATFKKSAQITPDARKAFEKRPDHPDKKSIDSNLKSGDTCVAGLQKRVAARNAELASLKKTASQYENQANTFANVCEDARKLASGQPTEANHDAASKKLESATTQGKQLQQKLDGDANYKKLLGLGLGEKIKQKLDAGNKCLKVTEPQLVQLLAAVNAKKAEAEAAAKAEAEAKKLAELKAQQEAEARKKAEAEKAKQEAVAQAPAAKAKVSAEKPPATEAGTKATAAKTSAPLKETGSPVASKVSAGATSKDSVGGQLRGSLVLNGQVPDFAVFYISDGSKAPSTTEAVFGMSGFEKPVYVVAKGGHVEVKNNDNALHRLAVENDDTGYKGGMLMLNSRQKKTLTAGWAVNTPVQIKSDKATQASTWVVTLGSNRYQVINVKAGTSFSIDHKGAGSGGLVMPGYDPVTLRFDANGNAKAVIKQKGKTMGEIHLQGS